MLIAILNKLFLVLFFMALLNTLRHTYYFIQAFFTSNEEQPTKYRLSSKSLWLLGMSLAYILSVIFTGLTI
jgi:hypothetical protein